MLAFLGWLDQVEIPWPKGTKTFTDAGAVVCIADQDFAALARLANEWQMDTLLVHLRHVLHHKFLGTALSSLCQ